MAMVQDPATAEYDRMPHAAVATGLADYVLPVGEMPAALINYVRYSYVNGGPAEEAEEAADAADARAVACCGRVRNSTSAATARPCCWRPACGGGWD